ncbi:MAG: hypothetical protein COA94_07205 [Rickettsiales bacterium]|nr:MAG: hypothetical protein COA94_07205 [Rickettsiales bacterium]
MSATHDAGIYKRPNEIEHVLLRPDSYIGSVNSVNREGRIFSGGKVVEKVISTPEGMVRLYLELLTNASDNLYESMQKGVPCTFIDIKVDKYSVTVTNDGLMPPIEYSDKYECYIPEMIFGMLRTSSNYTDDNKRVAGRNGFGAKLCNIFSSSFSLDLSNENGKKYTQQWENNMKTISEPNIGLAKGKPSITISYTLDFKRFGCDGYTKEDIALFASFAIDTAVTCKIPVKFNGKMFNFKKTSTYLNMVFGKCKMEGFVQGKSRVPDLEVYLMDTPYAGRIYSFVNGIPTKDDGVHVSSVLNSIIRPIIRTINKNIKQSDIRSGVTMKNATSHISMYISYRCIKPEFTGQMKSKLNKPKPRISVPVGMVDKVGKWTFVTKLNNILKDKCQKKELKTDGKKKKHISVDTVEDANFAGHRTKYRFCKLYVVEGKSAMAYAIKAISSMEGRRDFNGAFPMKGKPLNVMRHPNKVFENQEILNLKKVLGLRENVDYKLKINFSKLRYGSMVIAADSDVDGKHILGLIINLFNCKYRSLLELGYVKYMRTPIVRVSRGKITKKFYTMDQYKAWCLSTNPKQKWKHDYLKGLGTSTDAYIKDDTENQVIVIPFLDKDSEDNLELAFHPDKTMERKSWVTSDRMEIGSYEGKQNISEFINAELVEYSKYNLTRSIPGEMDGLKISQRKILYGSMLIWKSNKNKVKVSELGSAVSSSMGYHHGVFSLGNAIKSMASDYVGSNNLSYFSQEGQFGTRNMGGKDAADGRYSAVKPEWWWPYVYKEDDIPILSMVTDDGKVREPVTLLPIIPMSLVNGARGIATGYSTFIPCHSITDILSWYEKKLTGSVLFELCPWYRNYTGKIQLITLDNKSHRMVTSGSFEMVRKANKDVTRVTELPIGRWNHSYGLWLKSKLEKKEITDFDNHSTHLVPSFDIKGFTNPTIANLKLYKTYTMDNMVLLSEGGMPRKYENVTEILEGFYVKRLGYYVKRKEYKLESLNIEINDLTSLSKFIMAVVNEEIIVFKQKIDDIYKKMDTMGFNRDFLKRVPLHKCTKDYISELERKISTMKEYSNELTNTKESDMWLKDLLDFRKKYLSVYGLD